MFQQTKISLLSKPQLIGGDFDYTDVFVARHHVKPIRAKPTRFP
jgi:hypothetical protein